ncbi:hypothetical protein NP233_g11100 [Leucocoprinus birnbaumii]|uniref:DUF6533 domain-containing protein n=1 Tax=Leucocoprinus birnbaumii TaxID=56174 RepID=A0AAD5VN34_9AGAR|nr:hypothetical protein NP233_g11100 [Leucocoprinus birnbaumii]
MDIEAIATRLAEQLQRAQYLSAAALVVYAYDYFLTLDREIEYVWKSRWSPVKNLFLLNRYFVIVNIVIQQFLLGTVSGQRSSSECHGLIQAFVVLTAFVTLFSELMLCIRLWIMWDKDKRVLTGVVSIFVAITIYYIIYYERTFNDNPNSPFSHPPKGCAVNVEKHAYITFVVLIISDMVKLVLALIPTFQLYRTGSVFRNNVMNEVYREGVLFYVYLWIIDLVLVLQSADNAVAVVPVFIAIRVVLASRMVLHMDLCSLNGQAHVSSFLFSGSALNIRFGPKTQRKDRWNGGTMMLEVSVSPSRSDSKDECDIARQYRFDAQPDFIFSVPLIGEKCVIGITLIDWASAIEISSIWVNESALFESLEYVDLEKPLSVLVVGDSISCGFTTVEETDQGDALPRGSLDAFPFRANQVLKRNGNARLQVELVAYPGACLADPLNEEMSDTASFSMSTKFWHASPWSNHDWQPVLDAEVIVIALGTNDENNDIPFEHFMATFKTFARNLIRLTFSIREIWLIPPFQDHSEESSSEYRKVLLQLEGSVTRPSLTIEGIPVFICDIQNGMKEELTVDGLHPTLAGQEVLATNFAAFVKARRGVQEVK